jgi:SPOR domain
MMATNNDEDTGLNLDKEDRLPWLEAADSYDDDDVVSPGRLLLLVLGGLVLIGGVLGGLWWMQGGGSRGDGELIAAQDGPYKQPPVNDGAKQFEGEGDASFAASEGAEPAGKLDPGKMPEKPVVAPTPPVKTPAPVAAAPVPKAEPGKGPAPVAKAPVVASKAPPPQAAPAKAAQAAATKAAPSSGGGTIQLGAFSSEESAAKAWISLSKRFPYLQGLGKSVAPASVGGSTVYRLRAVAASGADASNICGRLKVAGENCAVIR